MGEEAPDLPSLFRQKKMEVEAFYKSAEARGFPFDADVAFMRKLLRAYYEGEVADLISYHVVQAHRSANKKPLTKNDGPLHVLGRELILKLKKEYKRGDWLILRRKLERAENEIYGGSTGW